MPAVAVIVMAGKVVFAQAVRDRAEGRMILRDMLARLDRASIEKGHF